MHPELIGKRPECNSRRPAEACPAPPLSPNRHSAQNAQNARRGCSVVWAQGARSIQKRCPPRTRGARGCARWRTSASGDRYVARGPPALGSEQHIARTLRNTSPHLFPPLVQLPDVPVSHHWESLQPWLGLPAGTEFSPFLPRPRVPQRRCGLAILRLPADAGAYAPPAPQAGVTG